MQDPGFLHFLEVVSELSAETQKDLAPCVAYLEKIDRLFVEWIPGAGKTKPSSAAVLALNGHASFRAAICLALSGQLLPVFMALRGSIESMMYANMIVRNPELQSVWLRRDDSPLTRQACRKAFTTRKCLDAFTLVLGQEFSNAVRDAYDSTIDFGAHPNSKIIMRSVEVVERDLTDQYLDFTYLHGKDSFELRQAFVACAEIGLLVFFGTMACCEEHVRIKELNNRALELQSQIPQFINTLGLLT